VKRRTIVLGLVSVLLVLAVWAFGVALLLARIGIGFLGARRLVRAAKPVTHARLLMVRDRAAHEIGLSRGVALLQTDDTVTPITTGIVHPTVLLPRDATSWSDERLRMVLVHELAHVQRRDCFTQLLAQLACALHWFNPLTWLANRRLRVEREMASDDLVVAHGTKASDYASHLLDMARSLQSPGFLAGATASIVGCSKLGGRLRTLLDSKRSRRSMTRRLAVFGTLIAFAVAVPLACVTGDPTTESLASPAALRLVYEVEATQLPVRPDEMIHIIERRLNEYNIHESSVSQDDGQIVVDLPTLEPDEIQRVNDLIRHQGKIGFTVVDNDSDFMKALAAHVATDQRAKDLGIAVETESWSAPCLGRLSPTP
jgi:beta-lactamase regulating signal transducer with metallopeptidase domain